MWVYRVDFIEVGIQWLIQTISLFIRKRLYKLVFYDLWFMANTVSQIEWNSSVSKYLRAYCRISVSSEFTLASFAVKTFIVIFFFFTVVIIYELYSLCFQVWTKKSFETKYEICFLLKRILNIISSEFEIYKQLLSQL